MIDPTELLGAQPTEGFDPEASEPWAIDVADRVKNLPPYLFGKINDFPAHIAVAATNIDDGENPILGLIPEQHPDAVDGDPVATQPLIDNRNFVQGITQFVAF